MKITKEYLKERLAKNASFLIGRAMVAISRRQTADEQRSSSTVLANNVGFSKPDARIGMVTARTYLNKGRCDDWQIAYWTAIDRTGYPRVCKYYKQLNEIAVNNKMESQANPTLL